MQQDQLHTLTKALVRILELAQETDPKTGYFKPVDAYVLNEICTFALHEGAPVRSFVAQPNTCRKLVFGPIGEFPRPQSKWHFRARKWLPSLLTRLALAGAQAFHHVH